MTNDSFWKGLCWNQQKIYALHGNQPGESERSHYTVSENGIDYGLFS